MVTKKDRRKNGYITPQNTIPIKYIEKYNLFINPIYSDWDDYRDGQRDKFKDYKLIKKTPDLLNYEDDDNYLIKRIKANKKQERLLKIRNVRKYPCK